MRLTPRLAALVLIDLVGGCAEPSRCPVAEPPAPVAAGVNEPPAPAVEPAAATPAGSVEPAAATRREQALAFVRLGYGDELGGEFRSLQFRSEPLSTDITRDAVALIGKYNGFEGVKVAAALEQLRGDIMYYEFGREASPVLYVHLPSWTHQQERRCPAQHCREGEWGDDAASRKLDDDEHAALLQRARAAFFAADADAIDPVNGNHRVLRVWWD